MMTDFRNNESRRRKVLGEGENRGHAPPRNFFRVIHKNLTDFRKKVETDMNPRLTSSPKQRAI